MKSKTKRLFSIALAAAMALSMTACGKSAEEKAAEEQAQAQMTQAQMELRQSDYRGGLKRTEALKESVIDVLELMKSNNTVIRETSPDSFWTADGYQDFVSTFLEQIIMEDTVWLNEEETSWETIISQYVSSSRFANGEGGLKIAIDRVEKDDYTMSQVPLTYTIIGEGIIGGELLDYTVNINGKADYRILYDCDKDWCKAYGTLALKTTDSYKPDNSCVELFEYQRINNDTFAIQTSRERLVIVLQPAETDTLISERKIKEFYYSKLVAGGMRTTFEANELLPEEDLLTGEVLQDNIKQNGVLKDYCYLNKDGDLAFFYGEKDSMFFHEPKDINASWVFEDKSLQQAICYKDGVLVVTTYNKLSTNYERFVYALADADEKIADELEKLVAINNLVGIADESTLIKEEETTEEETTESSTASEGESTDATATEATSVEAAEGETTASETEAGTEEPAQTVATGTTIANQ